MPPPPFFKRLRESRIVQALGVYLGTSWAALGAVDLVQQRLGLPEWVFSFALVLLLAGLAVVLATAWVQSLPSTTAREEAGELPSDWELAPAQALDDLRAGRIPHLTWARAAVGGAFALSLLFGASGLYVILTGNRILLGPEAAGADEAATGIAILPFTASGEGLELWREGMVDLLTAGLDGIGGLRTIDSRTVLARWKEEVQTGGTPDLPTALLVGGRTGARYVLVGNAVALGPMVRLSAQVYDLSDGSEVARGTAEGPADSVLAVVDNLGLEVMRDFLKASGRAAVTPQRVAGLTTASLPALRAFLEGEARFRAGDLEGAVASLETAVAADSTFALALLRLYQAYGWMATADEDAALRVGDRLEAHLHRLPPRDRAIFEAEVDIGNRDVWEDGDVEVLVDLYPDDPDAWNAVGEAHFHVPGPMQGGFARADAAFRRALELNPGFVPYVFHPLELAIARGDRAEATELLALVESRSRSDDPRIDGYRFALWAFLGDADPALVADSVEALRGVEWAPLTHFEQLLALPPTLDRLWRITVAPYADLDDAAAHEFGFDLALATGRVEQARRHMEGFRRTGATPVIPLDFLFHQILGGTDAAALDAALSPGVCGSSAHREVLCTTAVALHAADRRRHREVLAQAREDRAQAEALSGDDDEVDHAREHRAAALALEGVVAWNEGDRREALAKLDSATRTSRYGAAVWRQVSLLEQEGYLEDALGALRTLDDSWLWVPFAHLRRGEILERLGRPAEARAAYASALAAWPEADAGFEPRTRATAALERLGGG